MPIGYSTQTVDLMVIDNEQVYQRVVELVQDISPELTKRVQLYEGRNIFEAYGLNQEMEKLGHRIVNLESGGFLVIDKTEALTVIDVNTGSFVGDLNFADTAYALNLEAAEEIMRQLSLRDIGGMIIIDFIDMQKPSQQEDLLKRMRLLAQQDRTKTNVLDITALGLVEITRKKSRHNLDSMLYTDCPICQGSGRIESLETLVIRICREIRQQESIRHCAEGYHILVANQYVKELKKSQTFATVIKDCGVTLEIEGSKELAPGKYQLTCVFLLHHLIV